VPNIGAVFKMIVFGALIIGGIGYGLTNGFANEFSAAALTPAWSEGLRYLPAIIYGMLGFELVSAGGAEVNNPRRDVPLSILLSGVLIIGLYMAGTVAVLAVLPAGEINLVEGLIDVLNLLFGTGALGKAITMLLGLATLYTFFSNGVTWALGCNRASAQAAAEGQLPGFFGFLDKKHGAPVGSAISMGVVCTLLLIVYGRIATSNEDLFWALFAFSAVIFLSPYVGMVLAFQRMRKLDPARERPFKAPFAPLLTGLCVTGLIGAIALLFYVPGDGFQMETIYGVLGAAVLGEVLIGVAGLRRHIPKPKA
jgi:amino acid transporter